jgi:hypothetical protein
LGEYMRTVCTRLQVDASLLWSSNANIVLNRKSIEPTSVLAAGAAGSETGTPPGISSGYRNDHVPGLRAIRLVYAMCPKEVPAPTRLHAHCWPWNGACVDPDGESACHIGAMGGGTDWQQEGGRDVLLLIPMSPCGRESADDTSAVPAFYKLSVVENAV